MCHNVSILDAFVRLESQMVQVSESAVDAGKDPGNHSPQASMVCTADHSSRQSPLSCEGSVCDRASDYEDFWRPLGDSPGVFTSGLIRSITRAHVPRSLPHPLYILQIWINVRCPLQTTLNLST